MSLRHNLSNMKDIMALLRIAEIKRLKIQLGNYEKALKNTKDEKIKKNLETLIASTKQSLEKKKK